MNWGRSATTARWLAYSSTRRNGTDADLYVVDPRDPASTRMVAQVSGGGWAITGFAPDNATAVVTNYVSVTKSDLYLLDLASGKLTPLGDHKQAIAQGGAQFAPDGTLWATSDAGSDFQRLGTIDRKTGKFTARSPDPRWDVENFEIAPDGSFIAYVVNEAGVSRLKLLNPATGAVRAVFGLAQGRDRRTGDCAVGADRPDAVSAARVPTDAFTVDPEGLTVTRWTESETGGLNPARNAEPELVEVKSFDGEAVSGFLYRPDPAKFPGKRPLIVNIHGGPESQTVPVVPRAAPIT